MLADLIRKLRDGTLTAADTDNLTRVLTNIERRADVVSGWLGAGKTEPYIPIAEIGHLRVTQHFVVDSGKQTIALDSDGDAFFGSDLSAPATTSLAIFSSAQTYNSESMGAGDILFGDNTTAKANMLWDASAGKILFRGGTTSNVSIATDGAIVVANAAEGSGIRWLNAAGAMATYASVNALDQFFITHNNATDMGLWNFNVGEAVMLIATAAGPDILNFTIQESATTPNLGRYLMFGGDAGSVLEIGSDIKLYADATGTTTVFNETADDIDFRVEGDTAPNLIFLDASADTLYLGGASTRVAIDKNGDVWFEAAGSGLPFGASYSDTDAAVNKTTAAQNTWYKATSADYCHPGQLNLVTESDGALTVSKAGKYLVTWAASLWANDTSTVVMGIGITPSGGSLSVASDGQNTSDDEANARCGAGGTAILSLAASDEVALCYRTTSATTPTLYAWGMSLSVVQIGS